MPHSRGSPSIANHQTLQPSPKHIAGNTVPEIIGSSPDITLTFTLHCVQDLGSGLPLQLALQLLCWVCAPQSSGGQSRVSQRTPQPAPSA